MALITDYLAIDYNSFFDASEMQSFIDQIKFSHGGTIEWDNLSPADQENMILASVAYINRTEWLGSRNVNIVVLSMEWPRDPYGIITPNDIGLAQACFILDTLNGESGTGTGGGVAIGAIKKKTVGGVTVEYETGGSSAGGIEEDESCTGIYAKKFRPSQSGGIGSFGLGRMP